MEGTDPRNAVVPYLIFSGLARCTRGSYADAVTHFGDSFWYIVYFQKPGVAEGELEADVRKSIRTIHYSLSGDAPEHIWLQPNTPASAKLLDGLIDPPKLPSWFTAEDLDYYVEQFNKSGFRGPLNWYRNMDRNIDITPELEGAQIEMPAFFIAGKKDVVLAFADGGLLPAMEPYVPGLRGKVIIEGAGIGYRWNVPPR